TDAGTIATPLVINAAGPWAIEVGRWAGLDIPILNSARSILVTAPLAAVPADHPFVEDLSVEWYFRPEIDGVLMGMGKRPAPDLNTATPP
ncbi:MAG: FAD-binding oxidoreductase, partial [Anaerolineae bacterium]|nr:FAD-binding oxidoreductase [Anaerolineae bacterium]